ncbi:MAG: hypothetical protein HFG70_02735 [Hungatella sp.]|nr:hypothetical protein [Hungatella sp.]
MANILQVTPPNVNADNRNMVNPQDPKHSIGNPSLRNPVDPTRVVRSDGKENDQSGGAKDALFSVVDYESNYGAFIKGLGEGGELAGIMERLLFTDMAALRESGQAEVVSLIEKLVMSMRMDSPEDLLMFLEGQGRLQAKFNGEFFNQLRSVLSQSSSQGLQDAVLAFLKGYNNYSSGTHLLQQMHSLTDDIEQLLLRSYREEFRELADSMNWQAANGSTSHNTGVLNRSLIPFLSQYISRTHDYGAIREATMLLVFHTARYQDGGIDRLYKLFEDMLNDRDFIRLFKGDAQESMQNLLKAGSGEARPMSDFADGLSQLVLRGANGQAGLENVQQFYTIMNGMLMNESVYMPLLHFILPFQYEDNNVMSEMWVDPDAKKDDDSEGRRIKLFLKFDIQSVGKFELVMILQDHEAKVQLLVPPNLAKQEKKIQTEVADILKDNGIRFSQLMVRQRVRDRRVDEVFPEIREKERTINVRI